jgi:hypothetical protein
VRARRPGAAVQRDFSADADPTPDDEAQLKEQAMRTLTVVTATMAILAGAIIAPLANAKMDDGKGIERTVATAPGGDGDGIVFRRDGSKATPFVPPLNPGPTGVQADGFDWGDAATGAGAAMLVLAFGASGWIAVHRRRESRVGPTGVAY